MSNIWWKNAVASVGEFVVALEDITQKLLVYKWNGDKVGEVKIAEVRRVWRLGPGMEFGTLQMWCEADDGNRCIKVIKLV